MTPTSHAGALVSSVFSTRGLIFLTTYAILSSLPFFVTQLISLALLSVTAVQLAWRAMGTKVRAKTKIPFPFDGNDGLFELRFIIPVVVFTICYLIAPFILIGIGLATENTGMWVLGIVVCASSPVALLGYLRHGSTVGMFWPDTAAALIRNDPLSLIAYTVVSLGILFGCMLLGGISNMSFVGSLFGSIFSALGLLLVFGLGGLMIRKHTRLFDMMLDEDEWEPAQVVVIRREAPAPPRSATPYGDIPVVGGALIDDTPPPSRHEPIELDFDWKPPSAGGEP